MIMTDRIVVRDYTLTGEGYLHVKATLSRTGIQDYYGWEISEEPSDKVFRVYRPAEEVFAKEALASFHLRPVTDGHPFDGVNAETWRKEAVGVIGSDTRQDGGHMAATLLITDAMICNRIQRDGSVELSCGYSCDLIMDGGVTETGETYDAKQTNIRGNHVAIVEQGRCGPSCKAGGDQMPNLTDCSGKSRCQCQRNPDTKGQDEMTTKTVTIDGKQLEVTADVAAVIEGLQAKIAADEKSYGKLRDASAQLAEIVEKNTKVKTDELAAKDAEIADLKSKIPTADQIAATAIELAGVIADAKAIAPDLDTKGKAADAVRSDAVKFALGDKAASLDGKSADYITATFDRLVEAAKSSDGNAPLRVGGDSKPSAAKTYSDNLVNAWKGA